MTIEVILTTGRTFKQGEAKEIGRDSKEFTEAVAVCELDPKDMDRLKVKENDTVKVKTETGEVFVRTVKSSQTPHEGLAFMPMGPWVNSITGSGTGSTGMPMFKNFKAKVGAAKGEKILSAIELARSYIKEGGKP